MRTGFTLLELLVVLAIAALITAIVGVRLQGPYHAAQLEDTLRRIEFLDCQIRTHARSRAAASQMVFQIDDGRIYAHRTHDDDTRHCEVALPMAVRIECIVTPSFEIDSGTTRIDVSVRGGTTTYAVCVATSQEEQRWLLFSGVTGRVAYPKDETDVRQIFELLQVTRPDTH